MDPDVGADLGDGYQPVLAFYRELRLDRSERDAQAAARYASIVAGHLASGGAPVNEQIDQLGNAKEFERGRRAFERVFPGESVFEVVTDRHLPEASDRLDQRMNDEMPRGVLRKFRWMIREARSAARRPTSSSP